MIYKENVEFAYKNDKTNVFIIKKRLLKTHVKTLLLSLYNLAGMDYTIDMQKKARRKRKTAKEAKAMNRENITGFSGNLMTNFIYLYDYAPANDNRYYRTD
jgi:hypothetical protein